MCIRKKNEKIGDFYVNIEIIRKYAIFWHIMLFYFKKGKMQLKCKKKCAVYRKSTVNDRTY